MLFDMSNTNPTWADILLDSKIDPRRPVLTVKECNEALGFACLRQNPKTMRICAPCHALQYP